MSFDQRFMVLFRGASDPGGAIEEMPGFDFDYPFQELSTEGDELLTDGDMEYTESGSELLSDGDMEYGLGDDILAPFNDFTSDWANVTTGAPVDVDSFDSTGAGGVQLTSLLSVSKIYTARLKGTTTSTGLSIANSGALTVYGTVSGSGAFDETFSFTAFANAGYYLRNSTAGITDIDWANSYVREILTGPELLDTSGDGTADKDNWTASGGATLSNPSTNLLRISRSGANPFAQQTATTVGLRYRFQAEARSDGNAVPKIQDFTTVLATGTTSTDWQKFDVEYVAEFTIPLLVSTSLVNGEYTEWRNLSVQRVSLLDDYDMEYGLGAEDLANGDFADWTSDDPDGWTVTEVGDATSNITQNPTGKCQIISDGTFAGISQSTLVIGEYYRVVFDIDTVASGIVEITGFDSVHIFSTIGTKSFDDVAIATSFAVKRNTACDVTIDNVSLKEILAGAELYVTPNAASDPAGNEANATTGWANTGLATLTSDSAIKSVGGYSIKGVFAGGGHSISFDLDTILTIGKRYKLSLNSRHLGSGGDTQVNLASTPSASEITLFTLTNTDTTFETVVLEFTHSAATRYINGRENSGTDDGGVYIDNVSVVEILGTTDWTPGNDAALSKEYGTRTGGDGVQVLRVEHNGTNNPNARQTVMTSGKRYHVTGWARGDGSASPQLWDNGGSHWDGTTSTDWQYFDEEFTASGTDLILFSITSTITEYTEWDDVVIREVLGTDFWTPGNDAALSKQYGTRTGGSGVQVLRVEDNGTTNPRAAQIVLTISNRYHITGWARGDGNALPRVRMSGVGTELWRGTTSTDWQYFDEEFTADDATLEFTALNSAITEYTEWDDVTVVEVLDSKYWTPVQDAELSKETGTRTGGSGSLVLQVAYTGTNNPGASQLETVIGEVYRVTGWGKGDGSNDFDILDGTTVIFAGASTATWQEIDLEYVASGTSLILRCSASGAGFSQFDDFALIELIPEAGDVSYATNIAMTAPDTRDLVINGDFANWTGVSPNDSPDNWAVNVAQDALNMVTENPAGQCQFIAEDGKVQSITQTMCEVGKTYSGQIVVTARTSGTIRVENTVGVFLVNTNAPGTYPFSFTAVSTSMTITTPTGGADNITVDDFVIKQTNIEPSYLFPKSELLGNPGNPFTFTADVLDDYTNSADDANHEIGEVAQGQAHADIGTPGGGYVNLWRSGGASTTFIQRNTFTIGLRYRIETVIDTFVSGSLVVQDAGSGVAATYTDAGTYILEGVAAGLNLQVFTGEDPTDVTIKSISVKPANPLNTNNVGTRPGVPMGQDVGLRGNGLTSYVQLPSDVVSIVPGSKFSILCAVQVEDYAATRYFFNYQVDANNYIAAYQTTTHIVIEYKAGGTLEQSTVASSSLDIIVPAITVDTVTNEAAMYVNGVLLATHSSIGTWVGNAPAATRVLMALNDSADNSMYGLMKYWSDFSQALTQPQIERLSYLLRRL